MKALDIQEVDTYYGTSHVLHGLSLMVPEKAIVCLLGRNGAGKTTTIRSIMGMTSPRRGSIKIFEEEVVGWRPNRVFTKGVRIVPQGRHIFPMLTVEENLHIALMGLSASELGKETEKAYQMFPVLQERRKQKGRSLSGGQLQMLAIARAIMGNVRLLLMDEPSEGLAPIIIQLIEKTVVELKGKGITVLLAEQNLQSALRVGDYHCIIDNGANVFRGGKEDLSTNEEVKIKYLGVGKSEI
jgi:branched-chain amino acid transport system ATP-binding protein